MDVDSKDGSRCNASSSVRYVHNPTREELRRESEGYKKPVIITGMISEWPAFERWSIEYLNEKVGHKEVEVSVSTNEIFGFDTETHAFQKKMMRFSEFTNWIMQNDRRGVRYYLHTCPIETDFPELLEDVIIPDYFRKPMLMKNIWVGTDRNVTALHWDAAQNLLCQVRGQKRLVLFEPSETPYLYPFDVHSKTPHISHIRDIDNVNVNEFPKFSKAKSIECTINPGEMLFLPPFWWHHVYSIGQLNIALNFWWDVNFSDFLAPQVRRFIVGKPGAIVKSIMHGMKGYFQ
jgi:Cupin-like domain